MKKYITKELLENIKKNSMELKLESIDKVLSENIKGSKRVATFGNYVVIVTKDQEFKRLVIEEGKITKEEKYDVKLLTKKDMVNQVQEESKKCVEKMLNEENFSLDELGGIIKEYSDDENWDVAEVGRWIMNDETLYNAVQGIEDAEEMDEFLAANAGSFPGVDMENVTGQEVLDWIKD